VVRSISRELIDIGKTKGIEVILVAFDGFKLQQISLSDLSISRPSKPRKVLFQKLGRKLQKFSYGVLEILRISDFSHTFLSTVDSVQGDFIFSQSDSYLIIDANWDLPGSYYKLLKKVKGEGSRIILISYDLIPLKFPEYCSSSFSNSLKSFYAQYSKIMDGVFCISHTAKHDYLDFLKSLDISNKETPKLITSFELGSDAFYCASKNEKKTRTLRSTESHNSEETDTINKIKNKLYFLTVGSLVPHKNIISILHAFELFSKDNQDYNLFFVGNRGRHAQTNNAINNNPLLGNRIFVFENVDDTQLSIFYDNCYCLIQASFYEGYGLPVVESLNRTKPVVCSTGGALPEVGKEFCMYFNPYDPMDLYDKLHLATSSTYIYESLIERIKNDYQPVSWKQSADQLLSHIMDLDAFMTT
jgi:alpha-1,2-rhamnosyltransferase